jgi:hypothetical protein
MTVENKEFGLLLSQKKDILNYSNPTTVFRLAKRYIGKTAKIGLSTKREKKYMVHTPEGRTVHFGQMGYEDYTKHRNKTRRRNYLTRTAKMRGDWASNKYSANNLARKLLW